MGFWDAIRGRTTPKQANLDALFGLPSAALTLESALGLRPTGEASVCFRSAEGLAGAATRQEASDLVTSDGGPATRSRVDEYGYTWLTVTTGPDDVPGLVTDLHAVNSALEAQGFGPGLLCSVLDLVDPVDGRHAYVVYLYKQGTFYPFCPAGPQSRDGLRERQLRDALAGDLAIEPDTARWLPVWGLPA